MLPAGQHTCRGSFSRYSVLVSGLSGAPQHTCRGSFSRYSAPVSGLSCAPKHTCICSFSLYSALVSGNGAPNHKCGPHFNEEQHQTVPAPSFHANFVHVAPLTYFPPKPVDHVSMCLEIGSASVTKYSVDKYNSYLFFCRGKT